MKLFWFVFLLLFVSPSLAQQDPLTAAYNICLQHRDYQQSDPLPLVLVPGGRKPPYSGTWDQCNKIEQAWKARDKEQKDADAAMNLDLKTVIDAAKALPQ